MTREERSELLVGFRKQFSLLMLQAAEYESGRPGIRMENGIFAARECAETAKKYRQQAERLAVIISTYENANEG